jgi:hypothetical protein
VSRILFLILIIIRWNEGGDHRGSYKSCLECNKNFVFAFVSFFIFQSRSVLRRVRKSQFFCPRDEFFRELSFPARDSKSSARIRLLLKTFFLVTFFLSPSSAKQILFLFSTEVILYRPGSSVSGQIRFSCSVVPVVTLPLPIKADLDFACLGSAWLPPASVPISFSRRRISVLFFRFRCSVRAGLSGICFSATVSLDQALALLPKLAFYGARDGQGLACFLRRQLVA